MCRCGNRFQLRLGRGRNLRCCDSQALFVVAAPLLGIFVVSLNSISISGILLQSFMDKACSVRIYVTSGFPGAAICSVVNTICGSVGSLIPGQFYPVIGFRCSLFKLWLSRNDRLRNIDGNTFGIVIAIHLSLGVIAANSIGICLAKDRVFVCVTGNILVCQGRKTCPSRAGGLAEHYVPVSASNLIPGHGNRSLV